MTKSHSPKQICCAVYTRKSTEEGLEQEFNSLDAQREAGEAYIRSQKHAGWQLLPDRYDDGGFTGGNVERPALRRLFADIEARRIDCVVVYKVDRLSRSLLDFARMMEVFERHQVAFVSVTQRFDTSDSMGRLTLNMLMSFAQFEREMISERTRDKIAATRRKGKWSGGMPLLGYNVVATKLVVNELEAERVRQIFQLYLEHGSLLATVGELNRRGWTTKCWTTRKGTSRGGMPFTKNQLHKLLTNVTYLGKVRYKDEVHEGEQDRIISVEVFDEVAAALYSRRQTTSPGLRNKYGALLRGLLHCKACNCRMSHTYSAKGSKRYRYYVCNHAQQRGWKQCPTPSVPAAEIEQFVVDQIKSIGRDPELVAATVAETRRQLDETIQSLKAERSALERQALHLGSEATALAGLSSQANADRLVEFQNHIGEGERRLSDIERQIQEYTGLKISEQAVNQAMTEFDSLWTALTPREQIQVLELLIERVEFDGKANNVSVMFRPLGWQALSQQVVQSGESAA